MGRHELLRVSSFLIFQSCAFYLFILVYLPSLVPLDASLITTIGIHDDEEGTGQKGVDMKSIFCLFFTILPMVFVFLYNIKVNDIIQEEKTKDNRMPISPKSGFFVKFFLGQTGEVSMPPSSHRNDSTSNIVTVVSEMGVLLLALGITIITLGFSEEWTLLWKLGAPNSLIYLVLKSSMCLLLVGTLGSTVSILAIKLARNQIKKDNYKPQASILASGQDFKLSQEFDGEPKVQQVIDTHDPEVSDLDDCYSE